MDNNKTINEMEKEGQGVVEAIKLTIPRAGTFKANSLEEIDKMTDQEIMAARLSGASKNRLKKLLKDGRDYKDAKRALIRENFCNFYKGQQNGAKNVVMGKQKAANEGKFEARKRTHSDNSTLLATPRLKKARLGETSFEEDPTVVQVAIIQEGFPGVQLEQERLKAIQSALMVAYEEIPTDGPQVRFAKCTHRPGYLLVTCADDISAKWLREAVPSIKPWKEAILRTLEGSNIPKPCACTIYVPDEDGVRLRGDRIINRLRIGNRGLNTTLWTVWETSPAEFGQIWTISMDEGSLEELRKLDMAPYFGMGRLRFRLIEDGHKPKRADHASEPKSVHYQNKKRY